MLLSLLGEKLEHFVETKRISIHLDGLLETTEFELGDHLLWLNSLSMMILLLMLLLLG